MTKDSFSKKNTLQFSLWQAWIENSIKNEYSYIDFLKCKPRRYLTLLLPALAILFEKTYITTTLTERLD
jgi:hypothetical protein